MAEAQHNGPQPDRPFSVTLVLLGVFLSGLASGWRALGLFRQSGLLLDLGADPDPRLCALSSAAWTLLFWGLAFALWRRKPYTRLLVPAALLAYGLFQYLLISPCAPITQRQEGLPLGAIVYAAAVLFSVLALNLASGQAYYGPARSGSTRRDRKP